MKAAFTAFWTFLRAWSGDSAYETYTRRQQALGKPPLSREEFYLDALQRKYARVSCCC